MAEPRSRAHGALVSFAWHIWLPVVIVIAWWFASADSESVYFPPLSTILERTWQVWIVDGAFVTDVLPSIVRLSIGLAIAVVVGVGLGTLFGLAPRVERAFRPLTDAFRAVPGAALLPIGLMFFGTGEEMKIALIAFAATWPVLLNTIGGVRALDKTKLKVMDVFHISPLDRFTQVFLPAAAPQVFAGARVALMIGVVVMVIVEMFGTPGGIGYFIRFAQSNFQSLEMWTGMVVLGVFGYVLNTLFRAVEQRTLSWHHQMVAHTQGGSS